MLSYYLQYLPSHSSDSGCWIKWGIPIQFFLFRNEYFLPEGINIFYGILVFSFGFLQVGMDNALRGSKKLLEPLSYDLT